MVGGDLRHCGAGRLPDEGTGQGMPTVPEVGLLRSRGPAGGGVDCQSLGLQPLREVGPAGVGERDPFARGGDDRGHHARRSDARGEFSRLRPPALAPDANVDVEHVSPAIADGLNDCLLVAWLHNPHAGRP